MKRPKILIVDDEPGILKSLQRLLIRKGYDPVITTSPYDAMRLLTESGFAVIIADSRMPVMDGIHLLVKARDSAPDTIRILLTGYPEVRLAMSAINRGAVFRFITKPWDDADVCRTIAEAVSHHSAHHETRRMIVLDPLTQTYNRRFLDQRLAEEFSRCQRYHRPFSVILVDVDHFKSINDTWGHLTGDRALIAVAGALKANSRESDLVCRFGGDEFLIVLPETNLNDACIKATVAQEAIRFVRVHCSDGAPLAITVSMGVASLEKFTLDPNDLLHTADMALYTSKDHGRNRVCFYQSKTITEICRT